MLLDTQLWGLGDAADNAAALAAAGIDGLFTFEGPHDPFVPLVVAAGAGIDVDLYTNVAIALPRNPLNVAHQAWDLAALTRGRFRLGLGTQVKGQIERRYGAAFHPPVARITEFIGALHAIFACWQEGRPLEVRGEYYRHTMMPPLFNPGPLEWGPPPVWLGALGPRMVRTAATIADGLCVMPFNTARFLDEVTLPQFDAGLTAAGRSRDDIDLVCEVIVGVGRDDAELADAISGVRMLTAFYGSTPAYRRVLDLHGWGDRQEVLHAMTRSGQWDDMERHIDDEMLRTVAVVGSPAEVARGIVDRFGSVADRVGFYFPYAVATESIAELVSEIRRITRPRP
jgi:probable F420-dependent oxidoreductase